VAMGQIPRSTERISSFFLFFHFSTFFLRVLLLRGTSAIDLKLQHTVEKGLSSHCNIFWKSDPRSQN